MTGKEHHCVEDRRHEEIGTGRKMNKGRLFQMQRAWAGLGSVGTESLREINED